jgi:hypothetical protein
MSIEAAIAQFEALSRHLPGLAKEILENLQSE